MSIPSAAESMRLGRNSLDKHRFVVEAATFDELDQKYYETGCSSNSHILSMASTVSIDNTTTHPYLTKYADMYAHESSDANSISTGITFVGVKPPSRFKEGQKVLYTGSNGNGTSSEAIVVKIMYDDKNQPHYTIKLASGKEEQIRSSDKLNQQKKKMTKGATDENGNNPTNCVNFKTNPTPLFQSLYQGKWNDAEQILESNPDEASVWVTRYANKSAGSKADDGDVRWQLLPLHLYISLGGRKKDDDVPDDEKNNGIEQMHKKSEEAKTPPMQLLTALLAAYPQATQCTDDQNMIPLQSAIRGNSSVPIIEKLLEADPSSVYRKDARGRNAFVLAEKVYGKRIHKEQVGKEDKAREAKYTTLLKMLSNAERRVSSPARSQPKERVQATKHEDGMPKGLQQLQKENLALHRENAELRHRQEMNASLLHQLVKKLQMYEEQISVDIENYNEVFGSKDELAERREGILHSISEDDDVGEMPEQVKKQMEENQVGGEGAYHKRLERYHCSTPTGNKRNIIVVSPGSISTEASELVTPSTHVAPSVLLPELESRDEGDAHNSASSDDDEGNALEVIGEETTGASKAPSESDESSNANAEGQDIFRPRNAETEDSTPAKTGTVCSASPAETDGNTVNASSFDTEVTKDAIVNIDSEKEMQASTVIDRNDVGSKRHAISPVLSQEEEDQLCVE